MIIKQTDYAIDNVIFESVCANENFLLALIDTGQIDYKDLLAICDAFGYDDGSEIASDISSIAIVIPRTKHLLDFTNGRLHISTIGKIDLDIMTNFIVNDLNSDYNEIGIQIEMTAREKIEVLQSIIPEINMREVV